jgi:hypothetical protein
LPTWFPCPMPSNILKAVIPTCLGAAALFCVASAPNAQERPGVDRVRLNKEAFAYCQAIIKGKRVIVDSRGSWKNHQPSAADENEFIQQHGFGEYAKWHLGIDQSFSENTKARYKFPVGDFQNIHRCALLAAQGRARQYRHEEIEKAAAELLQMIDAETR